MCSRKRAMSFLLCLMVALFSKTSTSAPDTVIINGAVYSANPDAPSPEAIAIKDGTITFVGSNAEALSLAGDQTQVINVRGQLVLPGFIDNHNHVFEAASEAGGDCELIPYVAPSKQIPALKHCKDLAKPGQWLIGWGHTISESLDENSSKTPLEIIDSVFDQQPVIIMEQSSHSMWVNSAALELAGINADTPDPVGGKIMRDEDTGELLGILIDNAGDIVMEQAWNSLRNKFSASYQGLMNGLEESAKNGITTIGDGRMYWLRGWYEVWQEAEANKDLTARVSLRPWIYPHINPEDQIPFLKRIQSDDTDRLLIVNQVKM